MKENETKKFDQKAYKAAYQKENYKQMKVDLKPEIVDKITMFCKDMDISKAKFVQLACLYVIDNDLFGEIMQNEETSYCTSRHKKKKSPEELAAEINAEQERKEQKK